MRYSAAALSVPISSEPPSTIAVPTAITATSEIAWATLTAGRMRLRAVVVASSASSVARPRPASPRRVRVPARKPASTADPRYDS